MSRASRAFTVDITVRDVSGVSPAVIRTAFVNLAGFVQHHEDRFSMNGNQANVLRLLNEGKSVVDVAKQLGISIKTVETHKGRLARKNFRRH